MGKSRVQVAEVPTFICIGNGGSLNIEDVMLAQAAQDAGKAKIIVINDAFLWVPKAWALYGADYRWWRARAADVSRSFIENKFTVDESAVAEFHLKFVNCEDLHKPMPGLSQSMDSVRHGYSSGFQAMHLARNLGAKKIILLGYDYGATGQSHAAPAAFAYATSDFMTMVQAFNLVAPALHNEGVYVVNATRESALGCFDKKSLREALEYVPA